MTATWTSLAEFFHLLGLLLESGIPLLEALKLAGDGIRDPDIKTTAERLAHDLPPFAKFFKMDHGWRESRTGKFDRGEKSRSDGRNFLS